MKKPKRMKQANTTDPKKSIGKKQSVGHAMGGMFNDITKKKPELDMKPQTRAALRPNQSARARKLEGVKL